MNRTADTRRVYILQDGAGGAMTPGDGDREGCSGTTVASVDGNEIDVQIN